MRGVEEKKCAVCPPAGLVVRTEQSAIPVGADGEFAYVWTLFSYVEALSWSSSRLEPGLYLDCICSGIKNSMRSICEKGTVPSHQTVDVVHSPRLLIS